MVANVYGKNGWRKRFYLFMEDWRLWVIFSHEMRGRKQGFVRKIIGFEGSNEWI